MGIPKYFKHITSKYPNVVISTYEVDDIENLYFDMNCLIHPCVRTVTKNYPDLVKKHKALEKLTEYQNNQKIITDFENKIYLEIQSYLDKLIKIVSPTKLIYLSIDGVAPRAKMEQQRTRRYRSIKIKEMEDKIYNKYNISKESFDTNCITPGTIFMFKLSVFLKNYIYSTSEKTGVQIILDDCQNKGEGEHKILQHIRNNTKESINCIYGLDADLIMLSLCSGSKIYLLREEVYFGKVDTSAFLYLDIELLGMNLYDEIYPKMIAEIPEEERLEVSNQDLINDYICLCFLIGNDFLPHLNGIDILTNSINDLLKIYIEIYSVRQRHLVIDNNINFIFLRQILTYLFSNEDKYLKKYQKKLTCYRPKLEYSNEMELELEKLNLYPTYKKNTALSLGENDWINKYYEYYFNITNIILHKTDIDEICNNYIEGLQWNIKYYLEKCPSDTWYYKYRAAPCLRELSKYLISRVYPTKFENTIEFTPLEQLALVLPIQSSHLWAKEFRDKVKNEYLYTGLYPSNFKLDTLNHTFLYQCDPILMDIDYKYIKEAFNSINLSSFELERSVPTGLICASPETDENIVVQVS